MSARYARAQNNLGVSYAKGKGVPQDYVAAHMWFNIASANGHDMGTIAAALRELLEEKMTPAAILEAQRRARICMSSGYENCD